jgi:hypothetical protein
MLIERITKASHVPHGFVRQSPIAANKHAIPTVSMSTNDQ